jgi:hypothetical protein
MKNALFNKRVVAVTMLVWLVLAALTAKDVPWIAFVVSWAVFMVIDTIIGLEKDNG